MARTDRLDVTMSAAECARNTGLTVKALRIYERKGLLKPKRTLKDWRVYDAADLTRIGEISALRSLGFKLADIALLLRDHRANIGRMLELQQDDLLRRRSRIEAGLATLSALRRKQALGEKLTLKDLTSAIKESQMTATTPETIHWKRYEQARPRIAMQSPPQDMETLTGHYQFSGGTIMQVFVHEQRLMAKLQGQDALQLFPEAEDRYFYTDVPAQITFTRNKNGATVALTLHQNGLEQQANRVSAEVAELSLRALQDRIASGVALPESRKLAETLLLSQQQGQPCYELMTEDLALMVREQSAMMTKELSELGKFKDLTFLAVTVEGWDAYRAEFENGELDISLHVGESGKIDGALLAPPKTDGFWKRLRQKFR